MAVLDLALHNRILLGDCVEVLRTLPSESVQCVVTSPPYFGLRDYGVPGQLGLEASPAEFVAGMVAVFAEVRRVLRADGTCWVNMGDSYANDGKWGGSTGGKHVRSLHGGETGIGRGKRQTGLKPKDLCMMPARLALALQADGWWLRSEIVWHKPNPMPESVTDRPTRAHEMIYLLAKSERYYYDMDAIREPVTGGARPRTAGRNSRKYVDRDPAYLRPGVTPKSALPGIGIKANSRYHAAVTDLVPTRNKRTVWTVASSAFSEAHFATFPPKLIEPCVLAGTPPRCCETCGAPWVRVVEREATPEHVKARFSAGRKRNAAETGRTDGFTAYKPHDTRAVLGETWRPSCRCERNTGAGKSIVLDPFFGAGTVGVVARRHSRDYLGIELNPAYIEMAERRIADEVQPQMWSSLGVAV